MGKVVNGKMVVTGSNKRHKACVKYLTTVCVNHPGKGKYLVPAKYTKTNWVFQAVAQFNNGTFIIDKVINRPPGGLFSAGALQLYI